MPSYNSEKYIRKSVNSVLNQTYKNWELIIIDDFSSDGSLNIIQEFCNYDSRIKLIVNKKNLGVAESRNIGMKAAQFSFIAFLDSDDIWHEKKLELQTCFMQDNNVAISYTQYYRINDVDLLLGEVNKIPSIVNYNTLLKGNVIAMSTSMIDIRIVEMINFDNIGHEDYFFWLKLLKNGVLAKGINEKLVYYRVHSTSLSSNKLKAITFTWHIYRNLLKLNLFECLYYFFIHEFKAVIKRLNS